MNNCIIVPTNFSRCGACIYWTGEKEVNNNLVQYDMHSIGGCNNPSSAEFGRILPGHNSCPSKTDY